MKLLVLLLLPCLSLSEVVKDFGNCRQFFLEKKPPQFTVQWGTAPPPWFNSATVPPQWVNSVKEICQCLLDNNNQKMYFYATLYNTAWRIPIYSAYVFYRTESVERKDRWYIEPQLDGYNNKPCMAAKGRSIITKQAVNDDYEGQDLNKPSYDKGHLYPVQHTDDDDSMLASSTLTNAAPQDACFNRLQWYNHEKDVIEELESCESEAYVVTGVVPDPNKKLNNRVTVSKYYWRAYCCKKNNEYIGKGYFGPDGTDMTVKTLSVTELQTKLARDYGVKNIKIVIFPSLSAPPPLPPTPPPSHKRLWEDEDYR